MQGTTQLKKPAAPAKVKLAACKTLAENQRDLQLFEYRSVR